MSGGLLIGGLVVPVPGVNVIGPHDTKWSHLSPGDCRFRRETWVRQVMLHKTIADDPEFVIGGKGPVGGARRTAEYWQQTKADGSQAEYSGAHIVTGDDAEVACLADLALMEAFHATVSNPYSIGIETREKPGGGVYEAALDATVRVTMTIVEHCGIQLQVPKLPYRGEPLRRMLNGGKDCVGVFGHRNNTTRRGRWDPGDRLFHMLIALGADSFDFDAGEDVAVWKGRQAELVRRGHTLKVDGIPGPATTNALKLEGYRGGIWALGKA